VNEARLLVPFELQDIAGGVGGPEGTVTLRPIVEAPAERGEMRDPGLAAALEDGLDGRFLRKRHAEMPRIGLRQRIGPHLVIAIEVADQLMADETEGLPVGIAARGLSARTSR